MAEGEAPAPAPAAAAAPAAPAATDGAAGAIPIPKVTWWEKIN